MTASLPGPAADRREAMRQSIHALLGPGGAAAALFPGYEARPGQLGMAERIADAIDGDERLLVEAGTGTGKTLAYLVPALLSGRKVVVSTGTKTLQDQIATVDLPRLRAMFDRAGLLPAPLEWAVMKGLGNYVCRRRLGERDRQRSLIAEPELDRLLAFAESSPTGDRADLPDLADDAPLWGDVAATPETRIGPRCQFFESCFVTAMRRRAAAAPLIIVNHHLFFADLALKARWPEAQVLPPYEVVIFDEAHQIEDVATEFFGVHASTQRLFALARDLGRETGVDAHRAQGAAGRLKSATDALADALRRLVPAARPGLEETRVAFPGGVTAGPALDRYHDLDGCLEQIADWLHPDGDAVASSRRPIELAGLARRASALRADLSLLVAGRGREHVRWLAASARNVGLHASPVDVSPVLGRALDGCPGPIVLTSATLTVAGSFDYLRARVGLGDTASDASFASPFRYDRQALLYVAPDLPDPNHDAFPARAAARMADLCAVTAGRALLLFTSYRNMRVAEAYLRDALPFPLLVQGERPRHLLLASMRERVGSVLLATQSFWEGVDVPGEALSLVVMDRIPFAVPDDPLTAARIDRIRDDGGEPFVDYQLPRAALALKQGFGRLIRTRTDRGIVAVLDGRVARKPYGATLIASLPPDCPRTETLEDVVAFWTRTGLPHEGPNAAPPP
jgi:ATP-dependent DNA helicase DinG